MLAGQPQEIAPTGVGRNKAFRAQARTSVSGTLYDVPETPPRATPFDKLRTGLGGLIPAYVYGWLRCPTIMLKLSGAERRA